MPDCCHQDYASAPIHVLNLWILASLVLAVCYKALLKIRGQWLHGFKAPFIAYQITLKKSGWQGSLEQMSLVFHSSCSTNFWLWQTSRPCLEAPQPSCSMPFIPTILAILTVCGESNVWGTSHDDLSHWLYIYSTLYLFQSPTAKTSVKGR